jgi:pimeloyl-ACP methyl ester carboxylesterase
MLESTALRLFLGVSSLGLVLAAGQQKSAADPTPAAADSLSVQYHTDQIEGQDIFYREAGPKDAPAVLLLHFSMYVQDYGAPIGYRIASAHPERITAIVVQNGNAYVEGLPDAYWSPIRAYWADPSQQSRDRISAAALTLEGFRSQYLIGVKDPSIISPDTWTLDLANVNRPGNKDAQLDLLLDYSTNPPLYPKWQEYFRTSQPPMLIVWGKNDVCFPAPGAEAYKRDIKDLDFHLLDTGHFALEDCLNEIAPLMLAFLDKHKGK